MSNKTKFMIASGYACMGPIFTAVSSSLIAFNMSKSMRHDIKCDKHTETLTDLFPAVGHAMESLALLELTNDWMEENEPKGAQETNKMVEQARIGLHMAVSATMNFSVVHFKQHIYVDSDKTKIAETYANFLKKLRETEHSTTFQCRNERLLRRGGLEVMGFELARRGIVPEPYATEFDNELFDLLMTRARTSMKGGLHTVLGLFDSVGDEE